MIVVTLVIAGLLAIAVGMLSLLALMGFACAEDGALGYSILAIPVGFVAVGLAAAIDTGNWFGALAALAALGAIASGVLYRHGKLDGIIDPLKAKYFHAKNKSLPADRPVSRP